MRSFLKLLFITFALLLCLTVEQKTFSDSLISKATKLNGNIYKSQARSFFWSGIFINNKTGELFGTKVWLK